MPGFINIQAVLSESGEVRPPVDLACQIGESREGRPILGFRVGRGERRVSLIAGCHADEPVGPAMLDRLAAWLVGLPADAPILRNHTISIVPHVNPDGEARNAAWAAEAGDVAGWARPGAAFDLASYLKHVVREAPGDDVEFGFPRAVDDFAARPENRAVADFLRPLGAHVLHASFHGMAFAAGPWFLLEHAWADRTADLRRELLAATEAAGYTVHDVDRHGEKGFHRLGRGFTSRPDSRAMADHFASQGDQAMAALFRPSSMELIRSFGGDPLTIVSEMPLFLAPAELYRDEPLRPAALQRLRGLVGDPARFRSEAEKIGVRAMPIHDQMGFQLRFLDAAWRAASPD